MKRLVTSLLLALTLLTTMIVAFPHQAAAKVADDCKIGSFLGLPPWYEYLDIGKKNILNSKGALVATDKCGIVGPLNDPSKPDNGIDWGKAGGKIGLAVIDILLRLGGLIAFGFVMYGGVRLTLSGGEPDKFKQAKDTVINAIVGLLIILVATAAVNFVGSTLIK